MNKKKKIQAKTGEPWSEFSAKLDTLIRLSALNLVRDMKTQKEQIAALSDAGFQPKEIAVVLRTSRNTVNVTLNAIRKERASVESEEEAEETSIDDSAASPVEHSKPEVKEDGEKA
jgi:DNA-binding CsgD family transcriptional regulator